MRRKTPEQKELDILRDKSVDIVSMDYIQSQGMSSKKLEKLRQIRNLFFVKRWPAREIAEHLHISEKTVWYWIEKLRAMGMEAAQRERELISDVNHFLWELNNNYRLRVSQLWKDYEKAKSEKTKLMIIREIREHEAQHTKLLQEAGILEKVASRIEIDNKSEEFKVLMTMDIRDLKRKLAELIEAEPVKDTQVVQSTEVCDDTKK